jgi:hypothetical protein
MTRMFLSTSRAMLDFDDGRAWDTVFPRHLVDHRLVG